MRWMQALAAAKTGGAVREQVRANARSARTEPNGRARLWLSTALRTPHMNRDASRNLTVVPSDAASATIFTECRVTAKFRLLRPWQPSPTRSRAWRIDN